MTGYASLTSQHVPTPLDPQQNSGVDTPKKGISSIMSFPFFKNKPKQKSQLSKQKFSGKIKFYQHMTSENT